jgi:regulator of nonsense transcripts 1
LSDSDADRISVIHGPPGTGKTTVIAASVTSMMAARNGRTMWLIAQSNVAVKNVAEKLADVGFLNFKLLVSKDFHFDWCVAMYWCLGCC